MSLLPELSISLLLLLIAVAFIAGFIDAIAGGGGLLTIPALMLSGIPPHLVLGTNKLCATFGSAMASYTFYRRGYFQPRNWRPALLARTTASARSTCCSRTGATPGSRRPAASSWCACTA